MQEHTAAGQKGQEKQAGSSLREAASGKPAGRQATTGGSQDARGGARSYSCSLALRPAVQEGGRANLAGLLPLWGWRACLWGSVCLWGEVARRTYKKVGTSIGPEADRMAHWEGCRGWGWAGRAHPRARNCRAELHPGSEQTPPQPTTTTNHHHQPPPSTTTNSIEVARRARGIGRAEEVQSPGLADGTATHAAMPCSRPRPPIRGETSSQKSHGASTSRVGHTDMQLTRDRPESDCASTPRPSRRPRFGGRFFALRPI